MSSELRYQITINGKGSWKDYGWRMVDMDDAMPERDLRYITVPYRYTAYDATYINGKVYYKEGREYAVTFRKVFRNSKEMHAGYDEFRAFLVSAKGKTITENVYGTWWPKCTLISEKPDFDGTSCEVEAHFKSPDPFRHYMKNGTEKRHV